MEFCHQTLIFNNGEFQNLNAVNINVNRIMTKSPHEKRLQNQIKKCTNCNFFIIGNNNCENCDNGAASALPNLSIIDYSIPTPTVSTNKIINIVFCIDVSGSMGGGRLENVKKACCDTIDSIIRKDSSCKVTLITFESSTKYYGDGSVEENVSNIPPYGYLTKKNKNLLPISQSIHALKTRINYLQASGGTIMCGALAESIAIGDVVILCTDGATSDKNDTNYDQLIKFAKDNCVKINIIGFEGAEADLTEIQRFAYETNGIVSRTSSAIDLTNIFQNVAANVSSLSKYITYFDLITNKNEFRLNGLTETSSHVVTYDLSRDYFYEIQVLKPGSVLCIIQLQISCPDNIRVVTQKLNVSEFDLQSTTNFQLNFNLLKAKESKIISNMLFRDKKQFSEIQKYIKTCIDLYTSLLRTPPEELELFSQTIDIASKKGHQSISNMNDGEFIYLYNLTKDNTKKIQANVSYGNSTKIDEISKIPDESFLKEAPKNEIDGSQSDTDDSSSNVAFENIVKEHTQLERILTEVLNKNWHNVIISDDSSFIQCIDEACDNIEIEHQKRMITLILILLNMIKRIYLRFSTTIKSFYENKVEPITVSAASTTQYLTKSTLFQQSKSDLSSSDSENTLTTNAFIFQRTMPPTQSGFAFIGPTLSSNNKNFSNEFDLLRQHLDQINVIIERIQSNGLISDIELIKSKYSQLIKTVENYEYELKKSLITDINDITFITTKIALECVYKVEVSTTKVTQSNGIESLSGNSSICLTNSDSIISSKPRKTSNGSKRGSKKKNQS